MSERFELALKALGRVGALRWIRLSGGPHPQYAYLQVPFLGWGFVEPSAERLRIATRAVEAASTLMEWRIDASRRNWVLGPSRLLVGVDGFVASEGFRDREATLLRDQELCRHALMDLDAILRSLHGIDLEEGRPHR
ncbi:hypothetical protein [Streptomyces sp. NPDC058955]|uniref:hypothetical protein n=1 Tax=unclassified Streptomyces TaxID=2593676 RepID=UPI0036468BD8